VSYMHDKRSAGCGRRYFRRWRAQFRGGQGSGFAAPSSRATNNEAGFKAE